jgi:methylmalonyl-CoA/ethylmalonyl-CoA epimerase
MLLRDLVIGIDHIGVCVGAMDASAKLWADLLGVPVAHRECVDPQKTEAAFLDFAAQPATVELVAPMAGNVGLEKFLGKRGDGLHHLAFAVTDIRLALRRLADAGVALLDREPRPGARGHLVAFLHPRAMNGTLVELVEHRKEHGT